MNGYALLFCLVLWAALVWDNRHHMHTWDDE
jgi:hypothetical protein